LWRTVSSYEPFQITQHLRNSLNLKLQLLKFHCWYGCIRLCITKNSCSRACRSTWFVLGHHNRYPHWRQQCSNRSVAESERWKSQGSTTCSISWTIMSRCHVQSWRRSRLLATNWEPSSSENVDSTGNRIFMTICRQPCTSWNSTTAGTQAPIQFFSFNMDNDQSYLLYSFFIVHYI
jgi:hypothetical protein